MAKQWHGGKGSDPRPVDSDKYSENWDKIFGEKEWLDNPLEGDGVVHDKCGTDDCCGECKE
jgi:hypothetical protein